MNISVIASSYPRFEGDGTAPFVRSISLALQKLGNNVEVIAPYDLDVREVDACDIKLKRFKYALKKSWHIMGHSRALEGDNNLRSGAYLLIIPYIVCGSVALYRSIKKQESTVVHAHWSLPNGLCAWIVNRIIRTPYIISLHGSDVYVSKKNILFGKINELVLRGAQAITACSKELFEYAESHGGQGKTHLIAWGADPTRFIPVNEKAAIRRELNLPEDGLIIASLGRLVPKKGFDVLVSAFAQLKIPGKSYLLIGGSGPQKDLLVELSRKLKIEEQLILPGAINWNKTSSFLGACDIFVLPSIRDPHGNLDGLPTVLLEAMACGLPCIASDIGGVSLVIESWSNGVLVQPSNVKELTGVLLKLLANSEIRVKLGAFARESIANKYNWHNVSLYLIDIFNQTV